jgi:hypothetical protein
MITVYAENHTKPLIQNADLLTIKSDGVYRYHSAVKF